MSLAMNEQTPSHRPAQAKAPNFGLWIGGRSVPARSGAAFKRIDPYNGTEAGSFANGDAADAEAGIRAARVAFDEGPWPRLPARDRFQVLMRVAELLSEHSEELVERMVRESGKPRTTALGELGTAIRTFQYYAGKALDLEGRAISNRVPNALGLVLREPVGVAGFITPWNFPILNPVVKIAPALAVGCTVVTKPSHLCPGPTLVLGRLLSEAGLPDGAFNVVTSDLERGAVVGQAIAASPQVDKIAFTGSTATGQAVMRTATSTTKRVSLELGGKSANIVFADAPFESAAATSVNAFCFNSGQQCSAATRLLVQDTIHDRFVEALVANTRKQVLGDPAEAKTTMGPLINEEQFKRVQGYIDIGKADGKLVAGGGTPTEAQFSNTLFVAPTIFDEMENSSRLAQEEVFGPVLTIIPFKTEADAVRIANDSHYGLAGGVWSNSLDTALRVVEAVRTGKMFVNSYNNVGIDDLPHGGYKDSGIGREQGPEGLEEYQQVKTVQIRLGG
jgi:acyl-CoA reductase-like NAD-dependent aldehyde dehydrogenase